MVYRRNRENQLKLRICIPIIGSRFWLGGVSYIENLVKSLHFLPDNERPDLYLFLDNNSLNSWDLHSHLLPLFTGVLCRSDNQEAVSATLGIEIQAIFAFDEIYDHIDFFFLAPDFALDSHCSAAWIPDFQHIHLPHFFHPDEITLRNNSFQYKSEHARIMILSSRNAERDFSNAFPDSKSLVRILSFHTLPEDSWLQGDPVNIQAKYNLPDDFLICCNQFWIHKNHSNLFQALSILKKTGTEIHLVCTGNTTDYRCQGYFEELCSFLKQHDISDQVYILGNIPRADQIQLIRRSMAVVQPSLFEGWSTIVEDARTLGKTQILSDLEVHREQSPDFAVYVDRTDPFSLATVIKNLHPILTPGPNRFREAVAKEMSKNLAREFGRTFRSIALEACHLFNNLKNHAD
jgi:glycosyltransferase involved in cell wall biosynthesis